LRKKVENGLLAEITSADIHADMWSLDTPEGAKLYKSEAAVANSFYSYRFQRNRKHLSMAMLPLAEACPWLEIVPVKVSFKCEE